MGRKKIVRCPIGIKVQRQKARELISEYGADAIHMVQSGTPIEKALVVELRLMKVSSIKRIDELYAGKGE